MNRPLLFAWLTAGTLDLLSAFAFAGMAGVAPGAVLRFVASGPFGDAMQESALGIPLGLVVHFAIMLVMVLAYMRVAPSFLVLLRHPMLAGIAYGVLLWLVMYWVVRPLRWPAMWPPSAFATMEAVKVAWSIGNALFSHCILVGIPIAWITSQAAGDGRN